jgi:2-hydroxycyclohexanecarboxyl-CoA dehydrogenase
MKVQAILALEQRTGPTGEDCLPAMSSELTRLKRSTVVRKIAIFAVGRRKRAAAVLRKEGQRYGKKDTHDIQKQAFLRGKIRELCTERVVYEGGSTMRGLTDKIGIVTGGGSGIGRAIATRLADEGCVVAIFDKNSEAAEETAATIARSGGRAFGYCVDVTDVQGVEGKVSAVARDHGDIWYLVNAAGWDSPKAFLETTPDAWQAVVAINLFGFLNTHHVVCRHMRANGGGRVVNIASEAGRAGAALTAVYSACKGGMIAFTKSLARELAQAKILLNTICPGPTDTPLFAKQAGSDLQRWREALVRGIPLHRIAVPEDYEGLAAFLISEDASYMTGQTISVSGGLTMI